MPREMVKRAWHELHGSMDPVYLDDLQAQRRQILTAEILRRGLDGEPVSAALSLEDSLVYEVFGHELSMGKRMGLMEMVRMTKLLAARA